MPTTMDATTKATRAPNAAATAHLRIEREQEIHFFDTNPELERELAGQWVALDGETLVSHGSDLADVLRRARDAGHTHPYITRVLDPSVTLVF